MIVRALNFISTEGMTNETAPKGQVLVQYLEPSWGLWDVEMAIGYFDNPNDYANGHGDGWLLWHNDAKVNVLAYAILPDKMENPFEDMTQPEFQEKFGSYHPNHGSVGGLKK